MFSTCLALKETVMKIKEIRAAAVRFPDVPSSSMARRPAWAEDAEVANPMSRYPKYKPHRNL